MLRGMNGGRLLLCCLLMGACVGCATGGTAGVGDDDVGGPDAAVSGDGGGPRDATLVDRQLPAVDARVIDGSTTMPDASTPTGCMGTTTCNGVSSIGNISGDTGAQTLSAQGYQSTWIHVRTTEDYDGIDAVSMTFRATLTSPASANFDLFLYVNTGSDVLECATPRGSATTTGTDVVNLQWGETGIVANGSDDDRDVMIEVRNVSGTCAVGQTWSLALIGNQ